ncbi:ATP-dependent Clp protease ATP-binding subunit [Candidatus Roizmanbacteria bacterium]|nr:ATP-dependent Clp protease ATP-binding subunit [Candidatus Roizmanbacteria bacterium]
MKRNLLSFLKDNFKNFGEFVINIFIFLPYFFSVPALLKTLFSPWRNLSVKKTTPGFSFSDWGNRFAFNFISKVIGFFMRLSIISFYFIFQTLFMIFLPLIAMGFFLLQPFLYFFMRLKKSSEEEKLALKVKFVNDHLLYEENRQKVEAWFERYYQQHVEKIKWWKLSNLLSFPPLARDWSVGYTPNLDDYTTDLASSSYLHHINNIVNREKEINEIERILLKNTQANVIIVGEEGVGKHTIIDALAKKIYLGKTNVHLMYRRILKLNMEKILNKFVDHKQRENFFEELLDEAAEAKNIILFIDDFEKYLDFSTSLKKYFKTDQLQFIGLTSPFFYQKEVLPDEKISQLFNKVDVYEVSKNEALEILLEKTFDFEDYHQVIIPYDSLIDAIEKSEFYLTYIPFPEKTVDLLDAACVYAKTKTPNHKNFPKVTPEIIDEILSQKTHIPTTISSQMKEKLLHLEALLSSQVMEQKEAISKLSANLRSSFLLIGKRKKPLASFLFLGPTGVGKTATAKAVASVFFSSTNIPNISKYLIRFDMSNYQSKYDIPHLIGDVNSREPGLLSSAVREQPYGVLLLDEIEKADKDLLNIFLTIIDEGYFMDGFGHHIDCKNLVIIATSNAKDESIFLPEFINRFDGVITFNQLSHKTLRLISEKILDELSKDVFQLHQVRIKIDEETIKSLLKKGYNPRYGARNLERVIRNEIEDKIAKLILEDRIKPGDTITL